jgi:hypothetical protein
MSTRIRYVSTGTGELQSMRIFKSVDGKEFRAFLTEGNGYRVVELATNTPVIEGTARTHAVAKAKVKTALADLGVGFSAEGRKRGTNDESSI